MRRISTPLADPNFGVIFPDAWYRLDAAKHVCKWGTASFRDARKKGLKVRYLGRGAFVSGADLIAYIQANAQDSKAG